MTLLKRRQKSSIHQKTEKGHSRPVNYAKVVQKLPQIGRERGHSTMAQQLTVALCSIWRHTFLVVLIGLSQKIKSLSQVSIKKFHLWPCYRAHNCANKSSFPRTSFVNLMAH
jgi:hypothetical protein